MNILQVYKRPELKIDWHKFHRLSSNVYIVKENEKKNVKRDRMSSNELRKRKMKMKPVIMCIIHVSLCIMNHSGKMLKCTQISHFIFLLQIYFYALEIFIHNVIPGAQQFLFPLPWLVSCVSGPAMSPYCLHFSYRPIFNWGMFSLSSSSFSDSRICTQQKKIRQKKKKTRRKNIRHLDSAMETLE